MASNLDVFQKLARTTATLELKPQAQFAPLDSHFGLAPFATAADKWPVCKYCKFGMSFYCQFSDSDPDTSILKVNEAPTELIALYLCSRCIDTGIQKSGTWAVLQYTSPDDSQYVAMQPRQKIKASPVYQWFANATCWTAPAKIVSSNAFQCLPDSEQFDEIARHSGSSGADMFGAADHVGNRAGDGDEEDDDGDGDVADWDEVYEDSALQGGYQIPNDSSHIGGYPWWLQGYELIKCKTCKSEMPLYVQISGDHCWMGPDGLVQLFRCSEHKDNFQLRLSCT